MIYIHSDLPEVLDASTFIPDPTTGVEISGEPGATTVLTGTVATYTAESFVAPGEAPLLTSAAVADWTTLEGYRIRFTSGPADGAYSSVAAANPNGAGVNVARIPAPCLCAYPTPTYPVPAAGNGFVLEQLVEVLGYVPPVSNAGENILRGVAFPELVETRIQSANEVILWGCTSGDIEVDSLRINLQGCRLCSAGGFACALNGQWANIASTTIHWSLVACVVMFCDHCVWQEGFYFDSGRATMHHSGGFDTPGGDAMTLFNGAHVDLFGVWYGNGNTDYGIALLQGLCGATYLAAQPPIANGALGDAFVAGAAFAWGALPIVGANLSGIVTP